MGPRRYGRTTITLLDAMPSSAGGVFDTIGDGGDVSASETVGSSSHMGTRLLPHAFTAPLRYPAQCAAWRARGRSQLAIISPFPGGDNGARPTQAEAPAFVSRCLLALPKLALV